jgi:3-oxoacyl-[acyl-carrier-protein] synthase-3
MTVETAIEEGRYDARTARQSRQLAATVAPSDQAPVHLAVEAAIQARRQARAEPADIGLILYCSVLDTGFDAWNPPSYVQRELGVPPGSCEVAEIRSGCNGALVGVRMACLHLEAEPLHPHALVVAADCWREPLFDRWLSDSQTILGDAGTAIVLSRDSGFARIVSVCSQTDPMLEGLARGNEPFTFPHGGRYPVRMAERAMPLLRAMPGKEVAQRFRVGIGSAIDRAIAEAGITLADVAHVALPFLGWHSLRPIYFEHLGLDVAKTTFEYSRGMGHTGASDPIAGIEHLLKSGRVVTDDWILVLSAGFGFICTAAVMQATGDVYPAPVDVAIQS